MKKLLILAFIFITSVCVAQNIAYINVDSVLNAMPETKNTDAELELLNKTLMAELNLSIDSLKQLNDKVLGLKNSGNLSANEEKQYIATLQEKQTKLEAKKKALDQRFERKRIELLNPLLKKIDGAIQAVAEEYKFMAIFNNGTQGLIYINKTIDITPVVKNKLGLK